MTAIALVSVINHYHINGLHLFSDTLYLDHFFPTIKHIFSLPTNLSFFLSFSKVYIVNLQGIPMIYFSCLSKTFLQLSMASVMLNLVILFLMSSQPLLAKD